MTILKLSLNVVSRLLVGVMAVMIAGFGNAMAAEKIAAGEKVAVLFGPERAGLENDDIARANAIISVPVNPEFASLTAWARVLVPQASIGILRILDRVPRPPRGTEPMLVA